MSETGFDCTVFAIVLCPPKKKVFCESLIATNYVKYLPNASAFFKRVQIKIKKATKIIGHRTQHWVARVLSQTALTDMVLLGKGALSLLLLKCVGLCIIVT